MKKSLVAFSLIVVLLLGACGKDEDTGRFDVNDPLTDDDGQNDMGS